ncbi:MAG: glycosyltransferase family 2 protein [candidate division Zixibacteria bacterium]|nr:glycosyltransferase family 2 protein [candidate division Zixibacteria bacterium]
MSNPRLSVVCVTFNSADCLPDFLESLEKLPADEFEAIFVDNNSTDSTVELIQKRSRTSLVIQNEQNLGWSAANNQGLEAAKGDFVFFANPDIWFEPEDLPKLAGFLDEHPEFAAAAPQLLNPDGDIQPSCRRLPTPADMVFQMTGLAFLFPKSFLNRWKMPEFDHQCLREVEQPMASALLVRRAAFEEIDGLDERFFVFFGDVDFCRRLKKAGLRIAFVPEAKVFHQRGGSTSKMGAAFYFSSHFGFFRYLWTWSGSLQKVLLLSLWPLVFLTAVGRAAFASIFRR